MVSSNYKYVFPALIFIVYLKTVTSYGSGFECGPYGFICESNHKLRLCDRNNLYGPNFLCPANTMCNEESNDVCENAVNYIDPLLRRTLRCRHNERMADPTVPGCKGYILCVPNKSKYQAIKFKCGGNTIFNGVSRTCSSPVKYKCPMANVTKIIDDGHRRSDIPGKIDSFGGSSSLGKPLDCKNYKLSVRQDDSPNGRVAYFCPKRPVQGQGTRCTVFSNHFCLTLQRDDEDQFASGAGTAHRRPRIYDVNLSYYDQDIPT